MNPILRLLADLELVSEGKTRNPDSSGGGKPESRMPVGDESLHDHFRRRILGARTESGLVAALAEAQMFLRQARGGLERQRETAIDWPDFIVERYEGQTTAFVAREEGCHKMEVWRAREKRGRRGADGRVK